jgi:hypothetical protein
MNLANLTAHDFKHIVKLLEEKEALLARVAAIEGELGDFQPGTSAGVKSPAAQPKPSRAKADGPRRKRGQMKDNIIAALKAAGTDGLTVKEIATQLDVPPANVHTWFATTGKAIVQLQKLDNGKRVWVG